MGRVMRWVGWLVLGLFLVLGGLFAVSRWMGPTAEQRAALALLEADNAQPAGRNAFGLLWLLDYDVPLDEIDAVVAEDVAKYRETLADAQSAQVLSNQVSVAEGRFARHPAWPSDLKMCGSGEASCLVMVRQRRDDYARQVAEDRALMERLRGLAAFDHYRSPMDGHIFPPLPPVKRFFVAHTASALDFVEGDTDGALAAVCRDVDTWRRLSANSDALLLASIGGAMVVTGARLFSDMLAELPLDHPLPSICATAFDPARIVPDLCSATRGEAHIAQAHLDRYGDEAHFMLRSLLLDPDATRAMMAPVYAHACTEGVRRALANDTPIAPPPTTGSPWRLECLGNVMGCTLFGIAAPAYDGYVGRMQDIQAMLRTVDAVLRVREQAADSDRTMAQVLREGGLRPAVATWRAPEFDETTGEIVIPLRAHGSRTEWRIPLPGSIPHG